MSSPAGWYDDPQDQSGQRYWDGGSWTDHRRPRQPPPHFQAAPPDQGPPPYQGAPPYRGFGGGPAGFGYGPTVPSTPDGVVLAGWWKRVGARFLDGLIVSIAGLPLTGYFLYQYVRELVHYQQRALEEALAGTSQVSPVLPWEVYQWMIPAALLGLVVSFVYEYLFLTRTGATPGKKALGISVRLREVAGPPPGNAVAKRFGLYSGLALLGGIPLVGTLFGLLTLLNELWPLWDDKKQALHDKVAATNVVVGAQPSRGSSHSDQPSH